MVKKIKVVSTEFKTGGRAIDVRSVMHHEDGSPIMVKSDHDGREYPMGQVSSNFFWAKQDCGYERYGEELDKLFPEANGEFEFEYELVKLETKKKVKKNEEKIMCCGACGGVVGEIDFKDEHCQKCGNDLLMGRWTYLPKPIMDKIIKLRNSYDPYM